jgi:hypothetical protein
VGRRAGRPGRTARGARRGRRRVAALRLADSNLALLPAFPQLLRRAFLRGHRAEARLAVRSAEPSPREADLRRCAAGPTRPLPPFGEPGADLAPLCLCAALALLGLRAFLR